MKQKRSSDPRDGWQNKYMIDNGPYNMYWAIYSNRWHSVSPRKRISPWFSFRSEAEEWIRSKWKEHMDKKFENLILG